MERNADEFAKLYEQIYQDMFRFALYTLRNREEAEDVVSDTVMDAWKSLHLLKKDEAFRAWIFRILSNKCRQRLKSYQTHMQELTEDLAWRERDTSEDMDVRHAFYMQNSTDRMILALNIFAGYTSKEIAHMMDMKENTVRSRQSRALKKMREILSA